MKSLKSVGVLVLLLCLLPGCRNQSKEEMLQEGIKLSQAGNHGGAVVYFKNALEKDANYFEARYELGRAYLQTGKYEQAEKEFQKVLRQDRAFPGLFLELAEVYLQTGRTEEALAEVDAHVSAGGGADPRALDLAGRALAARGDLSAAEQSFEQAVRIDPGYLAARLNLAAAYLNSGRLEAARTALGRILDEAPGNRPARYLLARMETGAGRWEEALEQYRRLVELDPNDVGALYFTGLIHLQTGNLEAGRQAARTLSDRFPENPLGLQLSGFILYADKKYEEAAVELQKALKKRPELASTYFLGLCHYHLGNLELALSQMQRVLDLKPDSVQARIMVGMILLQQRRVDDAVREIRLALTHDEGSGLAHNVLGSAYLAQGKIDEAMAEFNRAVELDPNLVDAHLKKGLFSLSRGKMAEGESEIVRALSIAPEVLDTRIVLATHYLRQQNHEGALEVLKEGLQGKATDAVLYNLMAAVHFARKEVEPAIEALQEAKKANPDYLTPAFNLAAFHASRGDYDRAAAEYAKILQGNPQQVRALVAMAQVLEIKGEEGEAAAFYEKGRATRDLAGVTAAAGYHHRKGNSGKALAVLEEALKAERHPLLLELRGRLLLQQGKATEAAAMFEELEGASPGRGYPVLLQILLSQGAPEKAEALARKVLKEKPGEAYGHLLLAAVHEARKDLPGALKVLQEARRQLKQPREIDLRIGSIYERQGKLEQALETYRDLAQRAPGYHPALFSLASVLERSGQMGEARRYYEQTLRLAENFAPAQNNLAYIYADAPGKKEEALRLAMQAFRQTPDRPEVMDTLGYVLVRNGRPDQAVKLLEKAAAALPREPTVHYHMGLAYRDAGDSGKAAESLRRSLELGNFPEKRQAKALLAQLGG